MIPHALIEEYEAVLSAAAAGDDEAAHGHEGHLHRLALVAIESGDFDSKEIASFALRTVAIGIARRTA